MRGRVLGELEVLGPAGSFRPAAPRQRTVLALLMLEANRVVPLERLVDAVWNEAPPHTARAQVQICISTLRRALAAIGLPDVIRTRPPGYLFRAASGELDLADFDREAEAGKKALAENRVREATEAFSEALGLWSGEPLVGMHSRILEAAAARLSEHRLTVMEERLEGLLSLGMHHEVIGELLALTAEHPLRERLRGQLMTALYRDGRQAEALGVYRQARRAFIDELGLEPSAALQNLEQAILNGDPGLLAVPTGSAAPGDSWRQPRMLPAGIPDFTGREEEGARIRQSLLCGQALRSSPGIVMLTGRGGAGKTTLAVHAAHDLSSHFPDGQLYASLRGGESRPTGPADVLERFLRALGVPGAAIPEGPDERACVYRDRLAGRQVLIVLDDAATEDQVLPLLPGHQEAAVIVTSRVRLTRISAAHVEVDLLPTADAVSMIEQVVGTQRVLTEPGATVALAELCGGLPLALRIAAARLAARPHWTVARLVSRLTDEHRRLDELTHHSTGIRASIATTYNRLGKGAQRLFWLLGIIDAPDFGPWLAIPLLDADQEYAEDLLDTLVDIRLLDVERDSTGLARYRFHDLVRVFAREQLAMQEPEPERNAALRRVLGAWLLLAREAHRREYGGDYTVLHGPAETWPLPQAVVDAELQNPLAWYEAERVALVSAVHQAANAGFHDVCWDLAISSVTLFEAHSYRTDWRRTHEVALAATRRGGNRRGEAAMLYSLGSLALSEGRFGQAAVQLEQALAMFRDLGDAHGMGLADRNLGRIDRVRGNAEEALARYERALAAVRQAGDAIAEAHILGNIAQIRSAGQSDDGAAALLSEAIEIARRTGCRRVEAQARSKLGETLLGSGDLAGACQAFHAVVSAARLMGDLVGEAYALHGLGVAHCRMGDYEQADLLLGQAQRMATDTGEQLLLAHVLLARGELCHATARYAEGIQHLTEAGAVFGRLGAQAWADRTSGVIQRCMAASSSLAAAE